MRAALADTPPPGILRSVEVTEAEALILPLPFVATEPDTTQTFGTQADSSGLILSQWDALTQAWKTATLTPGTGWGGDAISLDPAFPLSLQLPAGQPPLRLSLGGILPAADLPQTLHPGLNHVGTPRLRPQPLSIWDWDSLGQSGSTPATSDELFDPLNQAQAWLKDEQGVPTWTGVTDPAQPGELTATGAYFYDLKAGNAIQVTGEVEPGFNATQLPAITAVHYDAAQDEVEITVTTASGTSHSLDLFYQDLSFPGGYDPAAPWSLWSQGVQTGAGTTFTFTDSGDANRPHPRLPAARLYQVGDASQDQDQDGLSDRYEDLVSQTDPALADTDADGLDDPTELNLGLDPLTYTRTLENADALYEHLWFNLPSGTPTDVENLPAYPYSPDQEIRHDAIGARFAAPRNIANYYGRRMFGHFVAPLTGDYHFYITSDDASELWLTDNGVRSKIAHCTYVGYQQWTRYPSLMSAPITLQAGQSYPLEAIMKENGGSDHLSVGVKLPDNRYELPIRVTRFLPMAPGTDLSLDSDSDGLSDYEESVIGTDPQQADTSGDGLDDYAAVVHNRDPLVAQALLPLLPAAWILQHDLNTVYPYTHEDPDGDLLTNVEEYLNGSDPRNPDTSGDGVNDFDAVHIYRVDPTQALFNGAPSLITQLQGDSAQVLAGTWNATPEGSLQAGSRSGSVSYSFTLAQSGTYALIFDVEQHNPLSPDQEFTLVLSVNGQPAGRRQVAAPLGQETEALFLSPALAAGSHSLQLRVENVNSESWLELHRLRILQVQGVDADQSGTEDWLELRAASLQVQPPLSSPVSPVCIEGEGLYPESVILTSSADAPLEDIAATPGPGSAWYADLNLDPAGSATTLVIEDRYVGLSQTNQVTWVQTNLLPEASEPIVLRTGDALLLNAHPAGVSTGDVTLSIGGTTYQSTVATPVVHRFESAGDHVVTATWTDGVQTQQSQTTVRAVSSSFSTSPVLLLNQNVVWENPNLSEETWVDTDPTLALGVSPLQPSGQRFELQATDTRPRYLWARLGEDGPVMDTAKVLGIETRLSSHFEVLETYSDGTRLVEMYIAFSDVPENLVITLTLKTGGVTFSDGSKTMVFTAADVGADGVLRYHIYQSETSYPRMCHTITYTYE